MRMKDYGSDYVWSQATIGGGGYITGLVQDPFNTEVFYARCDVAGVFKSIDGGKSWKTVNNGMSQCHHHCVQSFAVSPHRPDVLLRCSGDIRGGAWFGTVHKSVNGGESWYEVCNDVDFYGNGPTRMNGEVVAFDPHHEERVIVGGYTKGIYISEDAGESFVYSGLKGERAGCVAFHPLVKDRVYVGIIGLKEEKGRLYCLYENGKEWELLVDGLNFSEMAFDMADPDIIYVAGKEEGILKSLDGGRSFVKRNAGLMEDRWYHTVTVSLDPSGREVLYTAARIDSTQEREIAMPVYKSLDKGESWQLVKKHRQSDFYDYPDYADMWYAGAAISKIRVHATHKNRLYITNWYGCSISDDEGLTWSGNMFAGTETTCVENVVCHPAVPGKVYFTVADHLPHISTDGGTSYRELMGRSQVNVGFASSTAIVASKYRDGFYIYGGYDIHLTKGYLIVGNEDSSPNKVVLDLEKGLFVQALEEDPFTEGAFYAYIDGEMEKGAGLYASNDWGETWRKMDGVFPEEIKTLPKEKQWIEGELLPVVISQVKNVCGTNQLLCCDPHKPGTIYVGEWTEGLFMTSDYGNTWTNIGESLPFQRDRASILNVIRIDAQVPGTIYAGFIREGLWKSGNWGKDWKKIFPAEERIYNVSTMAVGGINGREICIACEPLYWSPAPSSVYYSYDGGEAWREISDSTLGAIRWKSIAIDKTSGDLYAGSCGNGCFKAVLHKTENEGF